MESYWNRVLDRRVSRRRAIAATGLTASAAAFLAACGGGDDSDSGGGGGGGGGGDQGSLANPDGITDGYFAKATGDGKRGGTIGFIYTDSPNLDILTNAPEYAGMGGQYVYDHMITSRSNANAPYVLEAAEALEQPDETTIRFKLRPGMTYHNIAPVNGRAVKASDVVAVQNHVKTLTGAESGFQNDILDRAEAPDENTVIYKLKAPTAYLFTSRLLGHPGPQAIIPPETFGNLATGRQVGSGPFVLDTWTTSTRYHYTRFDKYHGRGKAGTLPWRDATDVLVLVDESPRLAAFSSQQVHYFTPQAGTFKEALTNLGSIAKGAEFIGLAPYTWNFGMQNGRGPWANPSDVRMRQAAYRATDKAQMVQLRYGGAAVPTSGILAMGQSKEFLLDPKDTDQYFKYDVNEAKQLLSAVGWDSDKELVMEIIGTQNQSGAEIIQQQWAKAGLKVRIEVVNAGEFLPRSVRGEYDVFHGSHPQYDSPQAPMRQNHTVTKLAFGGTALGLPEIDAMIEKAERTTNFEENAKLIRELQIELLKRYTPYYNIVTPFNQRILNSKLRNFEIESSNTAMHLADAWLDA